MWHCQKVAGSWLVSEDHWTEDGGKRSLAGDGVQ